MIKISRLADYAVVILTTMGKDAEELVTASEVSVRTNLPEPTVAKVLKLLSKADLVTSTRGASGGYKPSRNVKEISIVEIVTAVDGPVSLTACVEGGDGGCSYHDCCPVKGRWDLVNDAIHKALEGLTLGTMTGKEAPVKEEPLKAERVS
jgi:FeS assembly SUF system regulator